MTTSPELERLVALDQTAGLAPSKWRVLAHAHRKRNLMEYEGEGEIDARLLDDLIRVAAELEAFLVSASP